MTLAEVAVRLRREKKEWMGRAESPAVESAIQAFEADPEFTMPARVRALAKRYLDMGEEEGGRTWSEAKRNRDLGNRIIAMLEGK